MHMIARGMSNCPSLVNLCEKQRFAVTHTQKFLWATFFPF